jgi:ABC-type branched-subunit amino acid transport system substrate-binding protein
MIKIKFLRLRASLFLIGLFVVSGPMMGGFQTKAQAEEFAGEIVVGYDVGITGAYAATTFVMSQAGEDYWKQHNYRITVDGKTYKIKFMLVDNKTDVSVSVSSFNRFVGSGAVIVRTEWTPGGVNLMPLAKKARVPIVVGGFTKGLFVPPNKYVYLNQPSYPGALCAAVKWYKENVWKGPGKMKLGLLLWDSAFGRSSHIDALYDYLKKDLEIEVLPAVFFPIKIKDFTPQLMRVKNQGANLIFMQALAGQYGRLAKDAKRLNVTPEIGLMSTFWCLSDTYIELAGDAAEGTYGIWHWNVSPGDDSTSNCTVQKLRDCMEEYRGNRYYDVNYFQGWMGQYINHHILELTIKKYGFPITGEQVADCASTMPPWDWGLSGSFSGYSGGDRLGWHEIRVFQVKQGKVVGASPWIPEPAGFLKRAPWVIGK